VESDPKSEQNPNQNQNQNLCSPNGRVCAHLRIVTMRGTAWFVGDRNVCMCVVVVCMYDVCSVCVCVVCGVCVCLCGPIIYL